MSVPASKLKENARPVQNGEDPAGICSAADSRLTVYQTVDLAKKFWYRFSDPSFCSSDCSRSCKYRIKGNNFNIPTLLNVPEDSEKALSLKGSSLAIFRLAPADYHRFHSPIDGEVGDIVHIPGQYYTGKLH